jgi:hypothetical protein
MPIERYIPEDRMIGKRQLVELQQIGEDIKDALNMTPTPAHRMAWKEPRVLTMTNGECLPLIDILHCLAVGLAELKKCNCKTSEVHQWDSKLNGDYRVTAQPKPKRRARKTPVPEESPHAPYTRAAKIDEI